MADQQNGQGRTWTEAPVSNTLRYVLDDFDCMLTIRGESGAELFPKVEQALQWLKKNGAEPTTRGNDKSGSGSPETKKICPIHHVVMKQRHGQGGDSWYSHRAVNPDSGKEYWCRGEQK